MRVERDIPVSLASSPSSFASSLRSNRLDSCRAMSCARKRERSLCTNHTRFQLWWFAVKHVCWLDAILNHSNGPIEEAHEMTL